MAIATAAATVTIDEMAERARALLPRLRERAAHTEALGRIPDESIKDLTEAGLFRVLQPKRYGGYELDYGLVNIAVASEIGKACGSTAWVQQIVACHPWILGMFPQAAQEAVWGNDPDTLIATVFRPTTGTVKPVDGGYWLEGDWEISSGCDAGQWMIAAMPDETQRPTQCYLMPRKDWEILDTWHVAGLKGTGSKDIRVKGAFVPTEFMVDTKPWDGHPTPGSAINSSWIYRLALWGGFAFNTCAPALGIARGGIEDYIKGMAGKAERPSFFARQLRVAESCAEVDAAEALLRDHAEEMIRVGQAGGILPPAFWLKAGRDFGYCVMLCVRAVERLALHIGAHGMAEKSPIQRALRDVYGVANHPGSNWEIHGSLYAKALIARMNEGQ